MNGSRMQQEKTLMRLVKGFRLGFLDNHPPAQMCFALSAPLQAYLSICGIETDLISGEVHTTGIFGHHWLSLKDGRIIDPTASQFTDPDSRPMPEVYIGPKPDWYLERSIAEHERADQSKANGRVTSS